LWACIGAGIGYALHSVITIIMAGRIVGFSVPEYLIGCARPLLPCVPMFFAVWGTEQALAGTLPLPILLAVQLVVGVVSYVISAVILVRPAVDELIRLGRDAIGRRSKTGT
jgi:hypothetical protein